MNINGKRRFDFLIEPKIKTTRIEDEIGCHQHVMAYDLKHARKMITNFVMSKCEFRAKHFKVIRINGFWWFKKAGLIKNEK